jgi:hypothetical protein
MIAAQSGCYFSKVSFCPVATARGSDFLLLFNIIRFIVESVATNDKYFQKEQGRIF